ncbi:FKBP-type peptidyl-prolyl cis-trans isomerase [Streptomyces sp. NPDC001941]|uniref:FKBP-type peptidyl-prolyl cis-trans isomerase n=1 Tax=Streptomyces sp. NPDC001941 TaxID=3154659 RepID=UPI0033172D0C
MPVRPAPRVTVLAVLAALAVGCSGPEPQNVPQVSGAYGNRPTVVLPSFPPPKQARMKVLKEGDGPVVKKGQVVVTDVDMRTWEGNRPLLDTYRLHQPTTAVLDGKHVARTWDQALIGRRGGSRVLMVAPATHGFGPGGMAPAQVSPSDHMVLVFDVVGGYDVRQQVRPATGDSGPGTPKVTLKEGAEPVFAQWGPKPAKLTTRTLLEGGGAAVGEGDTVVLQYTGYEWDGKTSFSSTYRRSGPNGFVVRREAMLPGWYEALKGARVGSRLLVSVPAAFAPSFTATGGGLATPKGKAVAYVVDVLDRRARGV